MHADTTCDLTALKSDLRASRVTIRYREGSEERTVIADSAPCGNAGAEVVLKPFIRVSDCHCQHCDPDGESEATSTDIPLADVIDIDVKEWGDWQQPGTYPDIEPLARWLQNKFGWLKRFALDC